MGDAITAKLGDTYFDDVDTLPVAQLYAYADFTLVKFAFEIRVRVDRGDECQRKNRLYSSAAVSSAAVAVG